MMNRNWSAMILIAALALPLPMLAQNGLYIDGAVGRSTVDASGIDENDTSFRFGAGWRFNPNFGLEVGYQDLGEVSEEAAIGGATQSLETDGFYAGLNARLPLSQDDGRGFYLGARAGFYFWDAKGRARVVTITVPIDDSDQDVYFGVGGGYDFNAQFGVGLNYDRYKVGGGLVDTDYDVVSLSTEFRF